VPFVKDLGVLGGFLRVKRKGEKGKSKALKN
jgi:hypothetical protein